MLHPFTIAFGLFGLWFVLAPGSFMKLQIFLGAKAEKLPKKNVLRGMGLILFSLAAVYEFSIRGFLVT